MALLQLSLHPQNMNSWIAILPTFSLTQTKIWPIILLNQSPHLLSSQTSSVLKMKFFTCCLPFPGKHHLALVVFLVPCFGIQPQPHPNRSLSLGQVPVDWKLSNITPVPKGGDPKLVSNYCPISLLSLPSKILEHIIFNQLLSHLLTNSLLSNSQFGFHLPSIWSHAECCPYQ